MFLFLISFFFTSYAEENPKILITDTPLREEFSERTVTAPYTQLTPQPLQLTSPYFENLFYKNSAIQVRSSGSPTTSIRGSSQAGRVLFVLDNVPLNFLDGNGGSSLFVPNEILDRINIFEGPSSATYGAYAMAGSVHFIPRMVSTPMVRLGANSPSDTNVAAIVPILHSETNQLQISGYQDKDGGNYSYEDANGDTFKQKNNSQQTRRFTLLGRQKSGRWKFSEFLLYARAHRRTPGATNFRVVNDDVSTAQLAAFSSHFRFAETASWGSRLSFSELKSNSASSFGPFNGRSQKYWINQTLAWEIYPGILSQTTAELSHNIYTNNYLLNKSYDRNEPEVAQSFIVPITENLSVEPIVRYLGRYDRTLMQLNLPYQFENGRLWFMYAEGFRPPSLNDLYANSPNYTANKDLQPETSRQYELGSEWYTEHVRIKSSLFRTDYRNNFQSLTVAPNVSTKINVGEASAYGTTHSVTVDYRPWLYELSYSMMLTRDKVNQKPLYFAPENQVFTALSYSIQKWTFTAQETLWGEYQDRNFSTGLDVTMPNWQSTDILASVHASQKLLINFGVYNAFNKRRELSFAFPEPQRRFAAALEYSF